MNKQIAAPLIAFAMLWAIPAALGASQPTGRFVLKQTSDGFMRLDTETGSIAHCLKRNDKWQCDTLNTGNAGPNPDIARLKQQNAELSKRVASLEAKVRSLAGSDKKPKTKLELPSDEELDEMMGFFEKLMSRLMRLARTFQDPPGEDI